MWVWTFRFTRHRAEAGQARTEVGIRMGRGKPMVMYTGEVGAAPEGARVSDEARTGCRFRRPGTRPLNLHMHRTTLTLTPVFLRPHETRRCAPCAPPNPVSGPPVTGQEFVSCRLQVGQLSNPHPSFTGFSVAFAVAERPLHPRERRRA